MKPLVVYVAGPYRAMNGRTVLEHVRNAEQVALEVWRAGHYAICPHLNTAFFDGECENDVWLDGYLEILRRCDALVLCPYWHESEGTQREIEVMKSLGRPVWPSSAQLPVVTDG